MTSSNNNVHPGSYPFKSAAGWATVLLTPCKCGIFGVCCEAVPLQVNYLNNEAVDTGKGENTVVSMVHHYLENHTLKSGNIHLHAVGQNKNNTVIQVIDSFSATTTN